METAPLIRFCKWCQADKEFRKAKYRCRDCEREQRRDNRVRNLDRSLAKERRSNIRRRTIRPLNMLLTHSKTRARLKALPFNLTLLYLEALLEDQGGKCDVTGLPFNLAAIDKEHYRDPCRPSIDRIDNAEGYVEGNVRIVLWAVNNAISEYGLPFFLQLGKAALKHNGLLPA